MHDIIRQLDEKRAWARQGGEKKRIAAQHAKGKLAELLAHAGESVAVDQAILRFQ